MTGVAVFRDFVVRATATSVSTDESYKDSDTPSRETSKYTPSTRVPPNLLVTFALSMFALPLKWVAVLPLLWVISKVLRYRKVKQRVG